MMIGAFYILRKEKLQVCNWFFYFEITPKGEIEFYYQDFSN